MYRQLVCLFVREVQLEVCMRKRDKLKLCVCLCKRGVHVPRGVFVSESEQAWVCVYICMCAYVYILWHLCILQ